MLELTTLQWFAVCVCAVMFGISKTGVPGVGILGVVVLADAFKENPLLSTGLVLPMLCFADIFAVVYYRRWAQWKHIFKLLPWAIAGIVMASILIKTGTINNGLMRPLIGMIVLIMLGLRWWWQRTENHNLPESRVFAALMGLFAGITTQIANAAGPIMVIYLLAMGMDKNKFIGTAAWYFIILNYLKVPIFAWEGRITGESLVVDVLVFPLIAAGAVLGIFILKKIPQKWFNIVVQSLAFLAAMRLAASAFMN